MFDIVPNSELPMVYERRETMLRRVAKKLSVVCCFSALLLSQRTSPAQANSTSHKSSEDVPAFILAGLQAYKEKGPEEAVRVWIKGSALDGSKDALSQANTLRQVQDYYGAYKDYEIVSTWEITPRTRVIYLVLDFDNGPLFSKFLAYRSDQAWVLVNFSFNTKEEVILPTAVHER
jgi:hypothetical protein